MAFQSILFERFEDRPEVENLPEPAFFVDLNLDQAIETFTIGREEYNLKPFFYIPLHDTAAIEYRHQIMRDLENEFLFERVKTFAQSSVPCANIWRWPKSSSINTRRKDGFSMRWRFTWRRSPVW